MKLYQPQQHLSNLKVSSTAKASIKIPISVAPKYYIRSTVSILAAAGETFTRIHDRETDRDPFLIKFRAMSDDRWTRAHTFDDVILIDIVPESPKTKNEVTVIVYKKDESVGGKVTSTISSNDKMDIE